MCTAEDNKVKLARQNARTRKIKNGGQHNLFQLITMLKLFSFLQCCEANYFQMYNKNYARARRVLLLFSDLIPYFFLELFHQQRFFCRISQEGEGRREREKNYGVYQESKIKEMLGKDFDWSLEIYKKNCISSSELLAAQL